MNRSEKRRQQKLVKKAAKGSINGQPDSPSNEHSSIIQQAMEIAVRHYDAGNLDEAADACDKVLHVDPVHTPALHLLGVVSHQSGNYDNAVNFFTQAITIQPDFATAHSNLGNTLNVLKQYDKALASHRKSIAIDPNLASSHCNLGNVHEVMGNLNEAVASYRDAISIKPDHAGYHTNLGVVFGFQGHAEEAMACYRNALAIDPYFAKAHLLLAHLKKHSEYDEEMQAMEHAYGMAGISNEQKAQLAFGLAKAFEDLHQYEKAFGFLAEGNSISRGRFSYSTDTVARAFKEIQDTFDHSLFVKHQGGGCTDETPIFIVGMPRSGTSLVEQILASHPDVYGAGELKALEDIILSYSDKKGGAAYPKSIQQLNKYDLGRMGTEYVNEIRKHSKDSRFITDKMPGNFLHLGIIKLALPKAKIIHCMRDPADNALSILKNQFSDSLPYAYEQSELAHYYNQYRELMKHWHNEFDGLIHVVQYENVVANQKEETASLLKYCGLPWDNACLEFYKTSRSVQTASSDQVRRPIYGTSVQAWKRYEKQLAPMLKLLG